MKYSPGEKHEIIRMVEASSLSVRKTLKKIEVSKSTFYEWYGRYLEEGVEGLVVLFPESPFDGVWGPGSHLVFRASMYHLKPVFVVSSKAPKESVHYRLAESDLFGVVRGYWVVPHPIEEGGPCDDED